jgi:RNA-binding protein YlmH
MRDFTEFDELYAKLEDMKKRAVRGEIGSGAFLSPREVMYAEKYLLSSGTAFFAFGGYSEAERKRIYVLPEYMESLSSAQELSDYGESCNIDAVCAKGSGFCKLTHRDFMGSILGLGISRDLVGDIVMLSDNEALVLCQSHIKDFLLYEWKDVGRDRIRCSSLELEQIVIPERKYALINDTVASPRLDCVVAALCNLSREQAKMQVLAEACEVDYESEIRPDKELSAPCLISVRGYGKFRLLQIGGLTKKGRLRLSAQRFL